MNDLNVKIISRKELLNELSSYAIESYDAGLFMCVSDKDKERVHEILAELERRNAYRPVNRIDRDLEELDMLQDGMAQLSRKHFYSLAEENIEWFL